MDMDKPKGFFENLFAFHAQYLQEHGTEPFSEVELRGTLMDFFIAGMVRPFYHLRHLDNLNKSTVQKNNN